MLKQMLVLQIFCAAGLAVGQQPHTTSRTGTHSVEDINDKASPPKLGLHWSRDFDPNPRLSNQVRSSGANVSPNMIYHGGKIMNTALTQTIFWGTSWGNYSGDKISGMDQWYQGFNSSNYAATSDEYTGSNGQISSNTIHLGHILDTSASASGANSSTILDEVCKVITNPDKSGNGYYAVYSDTPRGSANYCAYHSYGTCGGTPIQFAYFFNMDGDSGCDPQDSSGLHSQGLAALANISGHELSETRTDPAGPGAWYDASGNENGDKCAWTFGAPLVTFSDGNQWKIQGEWSNNAFTTGIGYPDSSGQGGCLAGK